MNTTTMLNGIYLSLRGADAWRMYREGAALMLMLDMFPASNAELKPRDMIRQWLVQAQQTAEFSVIGQLTAYLTSGVGASAVAKEYFEYQMFTAPDVIFMSMLYGADLDSEDVRIGAKLVRFLEQLMTFGRLNGDVTYLYVMADLWFGLCDTVMEASLTVNPQKMQKLTMISEVS